MGSPIVQPNENSKGTALNEQTLLGGVLALTALVYVATLRFDFVYDDQNQIVRNALVQSWQFVPGYFKGHQWMTLFPNASANYYRPLNFLWFRLNDAIFGLAPAGWHAMAILLHLAVTYLAYQVARRVTGRPLVAALTALLFGIHPTRHEVVAWVSGTTESLWALFFFAAFLAYLISRVSDRLRWMAVSCGCYAAGLLAKETAIVLPIVDFCSRHGFLRNRVATEAIRRVARWQLRAGGKARGDLRSRGSRLCRPTDRRTARIRTSPVQRICGHSSFDSSFRRVFLRPAMAAADACGRILRSAVMVEI